MVTFRTYTKAKEWGAHTSRATSSCRVPVAPAPDAGDASTTARAFLASSRPPSSLSATSNLDRRRAYEDDKLARFDALKKKLDNSVGCKGKIILDVRLTNATTHPLANPLGQ